ncbi:MAG: hypothetical protein GY950_27595 [bacterium]|nr:hypothetical protein [bacterium]
MRKMKIVFLTTIIFVLFDFVNAGDRASLVHNTLDDIKVCKSKLKLKLVRVWGGADEKDEHKFFETPQRVAVDKNGLVYICDEHKHCVKVFKDSGEYVRTIGQKGRGPGDLYGPISIALSPGGDLVVHENSGWRIQRFSPDGKSKGIIKSQGMIFWIGVTSKDQLVVYDAEKTFRSKKIISICNNEGKTIRQIGTYHFQAKSYRGSEHLVFAMDSSDNIYVANVSTPVIRKYSPEGRLILAITLETPFKIPPVKITLNPEGSEIKRVDEYGDQLKVQQKGTSSQLKGKRRPTVFGVIGVDSQKRAYALTMRRQITKKEHMAMEVGWSPVRLYRNKIDYNIIDKIDDLFRLLVFSPEGKVIAETSLPVFCDHIYVSGNRIFIVDGTFYQRVLEYEMSFKE